MIYSLVDLLLMQVVCSRCKVMDKTISGDKTVLCTVCYENREVRILHLANHCLQQCVNLSSAFFRLVVHENRVYTAK